MKRIFLITLICFLVIGSLPTYADDLYPYDLGDDIITYGSELWDSLVDKYVAMSTFGDATFQTVKDKIVDIAQREQIAFQKIYDSGPGGVVLKYVANGVGFQTFLDWCASLNSDSEISAPDGWILCTQSTTTWQAVGSSNKGWYIGSDVFVTRIGTQMYFASYSSKNNNSVTVQKWYLNKLNKTLALTNPYGSYYYAVENTSSGQSNYFTQFYGNATLALEAFYNFIPTKRAEQYVNDDIPFLTSDGLGSQNWQNVYNNNVNNFRDGDTVNNIFNNNNYTYNYTSDNNYISGTLPEYSFDSMDADISSSFNNPVAPPLIGNDYSFVTASFNILPSEFKGLVMLAITLIVVKFLLGLGEGGISK